MPLKTYFGALLFAASTAALAAAPVSYPILDQSADGLMNHASAKAIWAELVPPALGVRMAMLYPTSRFGFVSQVEGGVNAAKVCVVTARAMLMTRQGKSFAFPPIKSASAFDALANASPQQCKDLASAKLKEAAGIVAASLVAK